MHVTGWSRGLDVTSGGSGIVSHTGLVLLRSLADKTGLTGGLSKALATPRLLIHDRGRVLADLVTAIAGGAEVIEARHPGRRGRGQEDRGSDLHPAGCHGHPGALGQEGAEPNYKGYRPLPFAAHH